MLTSLGVVVWCKSTLIGPEEFLLMTVDFPLWHMGISGWEVMVMCTTSPFLLMSRSLRVSILNNIRLIHLVSLAGLLAYLVPIPELRLLTVGFGVASSCLAWSSTWYAEGSSNTRLETRVTAWTIGLIASSVAKFACQTNNPIWPIVHGGIGGWNKLGFVLAVLAVLRSSRRGVENRGTIATKSGASLSPLFAGFGLGGLFFGLHSLLSDSSTMISWVWEGYPVRGPIAAHGILTLMAMGSGAAYYLFYPEKALRWTHLAALAAGASLLTAFKNWVGYIGGLIIAHELVSMAPSLIASAVRYGPITFGIGFFTYNLMVLFHVWVVAYAFVPGGPLFREHTDWIMVSMVLQIANGVYAAAPTKDVVRTKTKKISQGVNRAKSCYVYVLIALELLAASISYLRFPTNDYVPYHKDDKVITAGIWTVHFSLDNDMWSSERRMRDLIKEMEIDVIGLLESDLQRIIMGNRDTTQFLAEDLGMYVDFGPGPNKHTWGSALLSKFPILNSTHHLLPSPVGELAPAIHATLDAYGQPVDVVVFHSGQEEDPEDRRQQSEYLAKLMKDSSRPLVLLSYLVTKPGEGNYNTYVGEKSGMRDIDPSDWDRWCEYILYRGLRRSGYARVSRGTITDTELQVGKFVVGEAETANERVDEAAVAPGLRFPALFRGEGVRGHRYHVFDEPRYFS